MREYVTTKEYEYYPDEPTILNEVRHISVDIYKIGDNFEAKLKSISNRLVDLELDTLSYMEKLDWESEALADHLEGLTNSD